MTSPTDASNPSQKPAPAPLIGKARLIGMAFQQADLEVLRCTLLARAQADANDHNALLDLSMTLLLLGQHEAALSLQRHAVQTQPLYHMPASRAPVSVRLLALVSCGDFLANTPLEFLIEDSDVSLCIVFVGAGIPAPTLPDHDVLIVAVGECDMNRPLLEALVEPLANWHKPVLNRPEHVLKTSRDTLCEALRGAPGMAVPDVARLHRSALDAMAAENSAPCALLPGAGFPLLVRPVGSHAGAGLCRIDTAADLCGYLKSAAQGDFYVSRFVEYRSPDGQYRKYRVVLVQGRAYLGHLGISSRWMVHYLNADMAENAANRAEEAEQMRRFQSGFGARHAAAFAQIHRRIGLDYLVMDCAETPDGRLLVFEADTCGVIHAMDPEDVYPYKKAPMQAIFAAFQDMLRRIATPLTPA